MRLLFLSVEDHLDSFPAICAAVHRLDAEGTLTWVDVAPWLEGRRDLGSPEGHPWGPEAHRILGAGLAGIVRGMLHGPERADTMSTGSYEGRL